MGGFNAARWVGGALWLTTQLGVAAAQESAPTPSPAPPAADATPAVEASPGELPPAETAPTAAPIELPPTPTPLPEGKVPIWDKLPKPRGYVRSELRYHRPQLTQIYDPQVGEWIAVGSPYLMFGFIPWASHEGYVEANTEIKFSPSMMFSAYADVSLLYQTLGPATSTFEDFAYRLGAATGQEVDLALETQPQTRLVKRAEERLLINELYLNRYVGDHVLLLAGKRRTYWGSAFTWTPFDMVNPSRNPLEPSLEREGVYSALADLSFDRFTLSLLYAPFELDNPHGMPVNWDFSRARYVARLYLNPFYQDVNVVYAFNDDVFPNIARHRVGLSYSGYPAGDVELHAEASLQLGRTTYLVSRREPTGELGDLEAPYHVGQDQLDNGRPYGDLVVGSRYNFADGSFLLGEYYFRGGGYDPDEYRLYREYLDYAGEAFPELEAALSPLLDSGALAAGGGSSDPNVEAVGESWSALLAATPYLFQDAFSRRHYVSVAYQRAFIADRVSPVINGVVGLEDGTLIVFPQVQVKVNPAVMLQAGGMYVWSLPGGQGELFPDRLSANLRMTARF